MSPVATHVVSSFSSEGDNFSQLRSQWSNPSDILSLLLIVGGDVVQQAIAQFVGVRSQPFCHGPSIRLTPVAFSFGWVACAFVLLKSILGDHRLMPAEPDCPSIVVNCENAFVRDNRSWILGRILRDHEAANPVNRNTTSIRIDIFRMDDAHDARPNIDKKWIMGWVVILAQLAVAAVPWIIYQDWTIFMVTLSGTAFALLTCALPQWADEKWSGPLLKRPMITALTRGNGHHHVMVFIGDVGGWDIGAMAAAPSTLRRETPWVCLGLTILWTLLLIAVSGLKQHTWYLIGAGGLGMIQNVYAAGASRMPGAFNFHLIPSSTITMPRPVPIAGDDPNSGENALARHSEQDAGHEPNSENAIHGHTEQEDPDPSSLHGVMGALAQLEIEHPRAGASLLEVFFPAALQYESARIRSHDERKFWKWAFERM